MRWRRYSERLIPTARIRRVSRPIRALGIETVQGLCLAAIFESAFSFATHFILCCPLRAYASLKAKIFTACQRATYTLALSLLRSLRAKAAPNVAEYNQSSPQQAPLTCR